MKLYLVRHGETELNVKKVYYGSTDCALTENGREQAASLRAVFEDMPLDLVLESPLIRAKDTATLLLGENPAPRISDDRLKELNFGTWEGKSWQELQGDETYEKWCIDWQTTCPPEGESFLDLAARVRAFYDDLLQREAETVLIGAHHAVLQQLMACLLEADSASCWHYAFSQGTYTLFEINHGFAVLKGHNLGAIG
ncbi:MAG: alpha-ribazole phosphatase [Firmicutes bacterium]|nr:alpha-ribazole phosphatase [Bacillota bacterium]